MIKTAPDFIYAAGDEKPGSDAGKFCAFSIPGKRFHFCLFPDLRDLTGDAGAGYSESGRKIGFQVTYNDKHENHAGT
ncbi:MAG: hypothetical protein QM578_04150 [Pantoea sp.]|uniref:hypothetical protein n=1 Tax=Pantoea sp. TaxID=69393 RepID=UPI0039E6B560